LSVPFRSVHRLWLASSGLTDSAVPDLFKHHHFFLLAVVFHLCVGGFFWFYNSTPGHHRPHSNIHSVRRPGFVVILHSRQVFDNTRSPSPPSLSLSYPLSASIHPSTHPHPSSSASSFRSIPIIKDRQRTINTRFPYRHHTTGTHKRKHRSRRLSLGPPFRPSFRVPVSRGLLSLVSLSLPRLSFSSRVDSRSKSTPRHEITCAPGIITSSISTPSRLVHSRQSLIGTPVYCGSRVRVLVIQNV